MYGLLAPREGLGTATKRKILPQPEIEHQQSNHFTDSALLGIVITIIIINVLLSVCLNGAS
jgi:uncharacterized membrane protein YkgB